MPFREMNRPGTTTRCPINHTPTDPVYNTSPHPLAPSPTPFSQLPKTYVNSLFRTANIVFWSLAGLQQ